MVGRVLVIAALCAGCRYDAAFQCAIDEQCRHGTTPGRCEPIGFCSFPDGACSSGYRFDDNSGVGYAGVCVGDEMPPPDAAIDDVPRGFDLSLCPESYKIQIASTSTTSRYRLITDVDTWWAQAAICDVDLEAATHLVTPQTSQEMTDLVAQVRMLMPMVTTYYAGAVQDPAASAPAERWILLDDAPVPTGLWTLDEPNDEDGAENHQTQLGYIETTIFIRGLYDGAGDTPFGAICECDGNGYGATARAYVDGDPNHPD